ncbi:LOW QUALITY PROTEIN: leucine-rich repeat transmembrane neuronal protein 2-like [Alosa sapidissima]|uniref:leucine-rich repeat transmembrane neuronal protein 2-like n=1 Tax=Alosa sapidissima TaxID=34773 RepID=UPI001C09C993|nr:leucine-rich repeat transmembrane neuronal protein 2-like [Alosa sapidissima]XP_041930242.1 LOW QUALITY PROTEIN: leucine-rich repeat transmembrane neuronal protein 2-like [Alosa sapidissima]
MGFHSRWPLVGQAPAALCVMSMLLCLPPTSCTTCPQKCRCEDLQFYCDTQGLLTPPDGIDRGALGLSLRHNSIAELRPDQFFGFTQLTWLHLDHNQITTVQEDAFQGLYKLKDLNLSSNRITKLPNTTFIHLINLQILDLSFNQMTVLEPELFHGLRKLQILHLRSNSLRTTPVRAFWDCRSLEYLGLSNNRLRSLARNGFAGLIKLRELHLEHNHLTKINLAHFPRLVALQFLYLQWNKINNLTCTMEWTWTTLEKLDLTGNEIRLLTPEVFETLPNLKILLLDNNKLSSMDTQTLDMWKSLGTIGLSSNLWECTKRICNLASWLSTFKGRWEHSILCHSPEYAQGEEILDAVYGFQLCQNFSAPVIQSSTPTEAMFPQEVTSPLYGNMQTPTLDYYAEDLGSFTMVTTTVTTSTTQTPSTALSTTTMVPGPAVTDDFIDDIDNTVLTQRVIIGTMALLFSFFLIIFVVYVSRKCCPPTLRRIRHCSAMQNRRQLRTQQRQPMADLATQVPYNEYEPSHEEGALVIINGYGQCKCQQLPYKECEV